jgi:hypothetical protein
VPSVLTDRADQGEGHEIEADRLERPPSLQPDPASCHYCSPSILTDRSERYLFTSDSRIR